MNTDQLMVGGQWLKGLESNQCGGAVVITRH
jgi:hypothetical protein